MPLVDDSPAKQACERCSLETNRDELSSSLEEPSRIYT
jgi:hypothetical protein